MLTGDAFSRYQEIRFESSELSSHMCGLASPEATHTRKNVRSDEVARTSALYLPAGPNRCGSMICNSHVCENLVLKPDIQSNDQSLFHRRSRCHFAEVVGRCSQQRNKCQLVLRMICEFESQFKIRTLVSLDNIYWTCCAPGWRRLSLCELKIGIHVAL